MATNGLNSSPPLPETLPPKKRNSKENSSDSSEHVFKTPPLFWNRNGFRRIRRTREPPSLVDFYSSTPLYHQSWSDVAESATNPVLSHPLPENVTFPLWGQHFVGVDHLYQTNLAHSNAGFYGANSHWNYVPTETRDMLMKNYRRIPNQHRTPIIKPIPHNLTSPYPRGILNKESPQPLEEERMRAAYWHQRLLNQRAPQEWRMKKKEYAKEVINPDPVRYLESGTEFSRSKYYLELKDVSQTKEVRTEVVERQTLPATRRSSPSTEQSKWGGEADVREELPLVARSGSGTATSSSSSSSSSSPWLLSRFVEGSLIELVGGQLKRVEELKVEDFEFCSESCPELSLKRFTVRKITASHTAGLSCLQVELEDELHSELSLEVCEFYPFFVCQHGWSSCSPGRTDSVCNLRCRQLQPGDVCLALAAVPAQHGTGKAEGHGGHPDQPGYNKNPTEASKLRKNRKRHWSAPELRNIF